MSPSLPDIVYDATLEIWREISSLSKPLVALITKTAQEHGLDPNYLVWVIRAGEHWPRMSSDQEEALRLVQTILVETGTSKNRFSPPPRELEGGNPTEDALRTMGSRMNFFKRFLNEAYAVGVSSQLNRVQQWSRSKGKQPGSDRDSQLFLHGIIQGELKSGSRFVHKPVIISQVLKVLS